MLQTQEHNMDEVKSILKTIELKILEAFKVVKEGFISRDISTLQRVAGILIDIEDLANSADNKAIVVFARFDPKASDLREFATILKSTNELVKISNAIRSYARKLIEHIEVGQDLSHIEIYMQKLLESAGKALDYGLCSSYTDCDLDYDECARLAKVEESKSDEFYSMTLQDIFKHDGNLNQNILKLISIARKLERIADHAVNVAYLKLYAKHGGVIKTF